MLVVQNIKLTKQTSNTKSFSSRSDKNDDVFGFGACCSYTGSAKLQRYKY